MEFEQFEIDDHMISGHQILSFKGLEKNAEYKLLVLRSSGEVEELKLDTEFNIQSDQSSKFVAYKSGESFQFLVNDNKESWPWPIISGKILFDRFEINPNETEVTVSHNSVTRIVVTEDYFDLSQQEKYSFKLEDSQYVIIINTDEHNVPSKFVTFEQVMEIEYPPEEYTRGPLIDYSGVYRHAVSEPNSGNLAEGMIIEVAKKGTIFNVTRTDRS